MGSAAVPSTIGSWSRETAARNHPASRRRRWATAAKATRGRHRHRARAASRGLAGPLASLRVQAPCPAHKAAESPCACLRAWSAGGPQHERPAAEAPAEVPRPPGGALPALLAARLQPLLPSAPDAPAAAMLAPVASAPASGPAQALMPALAMPLPSLLAEAAPVPSAPRAAVTKAEVERPRFPIWRVASKAHAGQVLVAERAFLLAQRRTAQLAKAVADDPAKPFFFLLPTAPAFTKMAFAVTKHACTQLVPGAQGQHSLLIRNRQALQQALRRAAEPSDVLAVALSKVICNVAKYLKKHLLFIGQGQTLARIATALPWLHLSTVGFLLLDFRTCTTSPSSPPFGCLLSTFGMVVPEELVRHDCSLVEVQETMQAIACLPASRLHALDRTGRATVVVRPQRQAFAPANRASACAFTAHRHGCDDVATANVT